MVLPFSLAPICTGYWRLWLCAGALFYGAMAEAASVNNLRLWRDKDHTRIVLDLDAPVLYQMRMAENPERIILDVQNTELKASAQKLALASTPIDIIRPATVNTSDLRLVFDLKQKVTAKTFQLKKQDGGNDRLVLDLYDRAESSSDSAPATAKLDGESSNIESLLGEAKPDAKSEAKPDAKPAPKSAVAHTQSASPGRELLIAVDAGHGGADSGALGPQNMREKDVTLAIAKQLMAVINAQPGYRARLTRSGDTFIELQKRRDLARDMKADLFISVHADAFSDADAYGASVFALSRKGATSEMARFLAQRENDSDLIGRVGGVSLEDKDAQLASVLVDLSMTATVNTSLQVGSSVLNAISGLAPLHAKHVEQAGFVVLKSPDVPSILVETGFISNVSEARKLASPSYHEKMAQAIFKGVHSYFAQRSVAPGPSIAAVASEKPLKSQLTHRVEPGDTLTEIAVKYQVSPQKIKLANNMKTETVKLGQRLTIPVL